MDLFSLLMSVVRPTACCLVYIISQMTWSVKLTNSLTTVCCRKLRIMRVCAYRLSKHEPWFTAHARLRCPEGWALIRLGSERKSIGFEACEADRYATRVASSPCFIISSNTVKFGLHLNAIFLTQCHYDKTSSLCGRMRFL